MPEFFDAGRFSTWLEELLRVLDHDRDGDVNPAMDVPCGACTACCTSSQFIQIAPDETATLARVPAALRSPAPGSPAGCFVMGYDQHGRCPMLVDGSCSIYEHRPRACRTYDCRIFAATGISPASSQPDIAARVGRWRFAVDDRRRWDTVRAAVPADGPPIERALRALTAGASRGRSDARSSPGTPRSGSG